MVVTASVLWMAPAFAPGLAPSAWAVSAPHTSPSYYIGGYNSAEMAHIGAHDGAYANAYCVNMNAVLAFGKPARYDYSTAYGGYGADSSFNYYGSPYVTDGAAYNLVWTYITNWDSYAHGCSSLLVTVGTSNSYECTGTGSGHDLSCSTQSAGYYWQAMVHNLANAAAKYGIYVDVGDDVEGGPQWDCYSSTYQFYYGMTTYGVNLLYWDDFGDVAYLEGGCNQGSNWTEGQLEQITLFFNNSQEDEDSIAQCYYNNGGVASPGAWGDYAQQGGTYLLASLAENLSGTLPPQTAYVDLTNDSLQSGILYSDLIYRPPYPY